MDDKGWRMYFMKVPANNISMGNYKDLHISKGK
jgi:hypothetical protein